MKTKKEMLSDIRKMLIYAIGYGLLIIGVIAYREITSWIHYLMWIPIFIGSRMYGKS